MNYSGIIEYDCASGKGLRTSLFVSGCTNNCYNCCNKPMQDYNYGEKFTDKTRQKIINLISSPLVAGLSILGGDPLLQSDEDLSILLSLIQEVKAMTAKDVWLWTGLIWEDIMKSPNQLQKKITQSCDIVVDGPYVDSLRDLSLAFRGSSNQRIIKVSESNETRVVEVKFD